MTPTLVSESVRNTNAMSGTTTLHVLAICRRHRGKTLARPERIDFGCWWRKGPPSVRGELSELLTANDTFDGYFLLTKPKDKVIDTVYRPRLIATQLYRNHHEFGDVPLLPSDLSCSSRNTWKLAAYFFRRWRCARGGRPRDLDSFSLVSRTGQFLNLSFARRRDKRENRVNGT